MSLIGYYSTNDFHYEFYQKPAQDGQQVIGKVANLSGSGLNVRVTQNVPVNLSNVNFPLEFQTTISKIQWLLQNRHFKPYIDKNSEDQLEEVKFTVIPPNHKQWKQKLQLFQNNVLYWKQITCHVLGIKAVEVLIFWNWKTDRSCTFPLEKSSKIPCDKTINAMGLSDDEFVFELNSQLFRYNWATSSSELIAKGEGSSIIFAALAPDRIAISSGPRTIKIIDRNGQIVESADMPDQIPGNAKITFLVKHSENQLIAVFNIPEIGSYFVCYSLDNHSFISIVLFEQMYPEKIINQKFITFDFTESKTYLIKWTGTVFESQEIDFGPLQQADSIERVFYIFKGKISDRYVLFMRGVIHKDKPINKIYHLCNVEENATIVLENFPAEVRLWSIRQENLTGIVVQGSDLLISPFGTIRIWDITTGKEKSQSDTNYSSSIHTADRVSLIALEDGSFASGATDGQFKIHGPNKLYHAISLRYFAETLHLLDGSIAIYADSTIKIISPYEFQSGSGFVDIGYLERYKRVAEGYHEDEDLPKEYRAWVHGFCKALEENSFLSARKWLGKAAHLKPKSDLHYRVYHLKAIDPNERQYAIQQLMIFAQNKEPPSSTPYSASRVFPQRPKRRLLIGEGNFTYTDALLKKHKATHPNLGGAITATELDVYSYQRNIKEIESLKRQGVLVLFGVDGTKIHEKFKGQRFERIQWNCPFLDSHYRQRKQLKKVVEEFFLAASNIQIPYDRVHVTLAQEPIARGREITYITRQIEYYNIVPAATQAGYRLIAKRKFDERYPEYQHAVTGSSRSYDCKRREFIFEKVNIQDFQLVFAISELSERAEKLMDVSKKEYKIQKIDSGCYFECTTDEDSSDYDE